VDINNAFHLYYKCCMWIEFQSISTWLRGFPTGTPVPPFSKLTPSLFQFDRMHEGHKFISLWLLSATLFK